MCIFILSMIAITINYNKMRFQFCGQVTCPEWLIAEISVLTKITAVKMKLIFNQLIALYLAEASSDDIAAKIGKLLNGTGLDTYEINAVAATLNFILHNSVEFHVSDIVLNKELIDLGLPKENVESITKSYKASREKLLEKALDKMPKETKSIQLEYSIHEFLGSHQLSAPESPMVAIRFAELNLEHQTQQGAKKSHNFIVTSEDLDELINQLEEALAIVDKMEAK